MSHGAKAMPMRVRPGVRDRRISRPVLVLVVLVVGVSVLVLERLMRVIVAMTFGQVEPDPGGHQHSADNEDEGRPFAEQYER